MTTFAADVCLRRRLAWGLLIILLPACNGGRSSPVSPTPVQAVTVFINGPTVVPRGASVLYTIVGRLTDGTPITSATSVIWSTGDERIATILRDGRLTAQLPGNATITATLEGTSVSTIVRVAAHDDNPGRANLLFSFEPDPVPGSLTPCGGAWWGQQKPTWSNIETLRETAGVGFTLKTLTYNFYNQSGVLTSTISFQDDHYFPPYDEHVEDGCMALGGAKSGSFEEILEGIDDKGNQLTFVGRSQLLPVP